MDRRTFLRSSAALPAVVLAAPRAAIAADPSLAPFLHGVASGDPLADRVVLWTRVAATGPVEVAWQVATDPALTRVVASGTTTTDADRDHTVKVDATGLAPATTYYFGFTALGAASLTGRTRTAPSGRTDRLRLALVSCSNYAAGYFNPYARLAERDDLDAVVHVGDYFYESATVSTLPDRAHEPARELVALADYRTRYGQYRLDPDLRRAHQQHPWIVVWDDHESCNDAWQDGSPQHDSAREGDWQVRKRAAVQAYREWMPIRMPDPADEIRIWRHLPYGDLVDLVMVDTRLWGRNAPATSTTITDNGSDDPARSMLGPAQFAFLTGQLDASKARGTLWRLIGNQTMISPHTNNPATGPAIPYLPDGATEVVDLRQGGGNEGADNWGAYRVERDALIAHLRDRDVRDNVVLTGDIHTAWGCDVVEDPANPAVYDRLTGRGSVGVEVVCTSVTSNNLEETTMSDDAVAGVNAAIIASNQNVQHTDQSGHGYCLLDVDRERVVVEWWETGTARVRSTTHAVEAVFQTVRGSNHLTPALAASTPPDGQPEQAPDTPPGSAPAPVVPEAPVAALLPLAALAAAGLVALRRRGADPEQA